MKLSKQNEPRFMNQASAASRPLSRVRSATIRLGVVCCIATACQAAAEVHRLNTDEMKMFELVSKDHGQMRPKISLDPILCKVARQRGTDMARRNYFDHVNPNGRGPNFLVRKAGFVLPSFYDGSRSGNNIESIAMHTGDSKAAFALWMESEPHRTHMLGQESFYQGQTSVGVGIFRSPNPPHYRYYVFLSAPPNESTRPPLVILKDPKGRVIARTRPAVTDSPDSCRAN